MSFEMCQQPNDHSRSRSDTTFKDPPIKGSVVSSIKGLLGTITLVILLISVSLASGVSMILIPGESLIAIKVLTTQALIVALAYQLTLISLLHNMFKEKLHPVSLALLILTAVLSIIGAVGSKTYLVVVGFYEGLDIQLDQSLLLAFAFQAIVSVLPYSAVPGAEGQRSIWGMKLAAFAVVLLPMLQFFFELVFGSFFMSLDILLYLKLLICFAYPIGVGLFKSSVDSKDYSGISQDRFETEDLFEFYSFMTASLPFRYISFSYSNWFGYLQHLGIKFVYKGFMHVLLPIFSIQIFAFKNRCRKQPQPSLDATYYIPGQKLPGTYADFIAQIQRNLCFHQFSDILDIGLLIVITSVSYVVTPIQMQKGYATVLTQEFFLALTYQLLGDVALEVVFTLFAYAMIKTKYPFLYTPFSVTCK
jgi:hypothetical protein